MACTHAHCVTESVVNVFNTTTQTSSRSCIGRDAAAGESEARKERGRLGGATLPVLRAFVRRLCAVVRQCAVLQCAGVLPCAGRCAVEGGAVLRFVRSIRVG